MPRFQEQFTRPQGTAVYDLDIIVGRYGRLKQYRELNEHSLYS